MVSEQLKFIFFISEASFYLIEENDFQDFLEEIRHLGCLKNLTKIFWFFFYRTNKTFSTFVQLKDYTKS